MGHVGHGSRGSWVSSLIGQMGHGSRGHGLRGSWVTWVIGHVGRGSVQ